MNKVLLVAVDEWRYWLRSHVVVIGLVVFASLLIVTSILTANRVSEQRDERLFYQQQAEEAFINQPARHPHRMVHYGHYVFRTPTPLAHFDPGLDTVTGQSIFLEGHHQNTAMFADEKASAQTGGFGSLTPALIYQLFLPLLLIAAGHAVIVRERESKTLAALFAQGLTGSTLYVGKAVALLGLVAVLSLPALFGAGFAVALGESLSAPLALYASYFVYLSIWGALILTISCLVNSRGVALGVSLLVWIFCALIVPRIAVTFTSYSLPSEGKIITDMRMNEDLRELGDGHNSFDPAFTNLRDNLLAQYDVDRVEDLPVNFRGVVATASEEELTNTLNRYADQRMARELAQSKRLDSFGIISPFVAIKAVSRNLSGTDIQTHHRFLREAEDLRYDFVQGLNKVHVEQLAYSDDINRSNVAEAERRTRVSPENWQLLKDFRFEAAPGSARIANASAPFLSLLAWMFVVVVVGMSAARKLRP